MADVSSTLAAWSSTTASNNPAGSTSIGTGLDDNLREIQGVIVRGLSHKGADIASVAGTMDIGAVEGLMHDITGALAITGLGTVRAGILKVLKFEGAATLTHNATSLILPGGSNIIAADGDMGIFISEGSGNWRCLNYVKASGSALKGGWELIQTQTASSSATIDFTTGINSTYDEYVISFSGVVPQTDNTTLHLRVSENGSAWEADATDYEYEVHTVIAGASGFASSTGAAQYLVAASGLGSSTGESISGNVFFFAPSSATLYKAFRTVYTQYNATPALVNGSSAGLYNGSQNAIVGVRFLMSSGNIASGTFALYGIRK